MHLIGPLAEGHTLLAPKYHCGRLDEVPDEYLSELLPLVKKVVFATGCKDYNIVQVSIAKSDLLLDEWFRIMAMLG